MAASNPVRIVDGEIGNRYLTVNADGSIDTNTSLPAGTAVEITDGTDTLGINPDGSINAVIPTSSPVPTTLPAEMRGTFGRLRTADPSTLFSSKQIFDNQPYLWDDQEVSGGGTSSTHSVNRASTTLGVSATTAGRRVRQTFRRINYQPGKSQLYFMTFVNLQAVSGVTKRVGTFDDNNGLFLEHNGVTARVVRRSNVTGTPVDTAVDQASWNLDTMDGAGVSGITLDFATAQILVIDFEWLGVGSARFGFVVDGAIVYCHQFQAANNLTSVYMSTPNNPLRYTIQNDGTGGVDTFEVICATAISEGGRQEVGRKGYVSNGATHVDADVAGTLYALVGIRLKSAYLGMTLRVNSVSVLTETNDNFEWVLLFNPTVAGTFTYNDVSGRSIQVATGATANTVTGGFSLGGDYGSLATNSAGTAINDVDTLVALGASIAGVQDTIVLCARPLTANADLSGGINYVELS